MAVPTRQIEHLLIGGPHDGRRINLPEDQAYLVMPCADTTRGGVGRAYYHAHRLGWLGGDLTVMALEGMSAEGVLRMLVEGYRPCNSNTEPKPKLTP